jgi:ribosomal protein S18 acetylase RimI-like enzyme
VIEVRRALTDAWSTWRDLRLLALATDPGAFSSRLVDWLDAGEERWRGGFERVPFRAMAFVAGDPVGMIGCLEPDQTRKQMVEIVSVWVAPVARGRGVGDALLTAAATWAAEHHPGRPLVLQVREGNAAAIGLYRRHGFLDAGPSSTEVPGEPPERTMVRRG